MSSGDIIILSGPPHADGRFFKTKSLDDFIEYFSKDFDYNLRIEVNIFYGGNDASLEYSERLCNGLQLIFEEKKIEGFTLVPNGRSNPIYLDKDSKHWWLIMSIN